MFGVYLPLAILFDRLWGYAGIFAAAVRTVRRGTQDGKVIAPLDGYRATQSEMLVASAPAGIGWQDHCGLAAPEMYADRSRIQLIDHLRGGFLYRTLQPLAVASDLEPH